MPPKAKSTPPPSAADNKQTPPLHKAAGEGNRAKVKRLLAKSKNASKDANTPTADGRTPLFYAVEGGNEGVITDLLSAKASVNATAKIEVSSGKTLSGATLLHSSVLFDHPAAIDIFVSKGVKVNRRCDGLTPLHLATILDRPAAVRALIRHGASVNLGSNNKIRPLHLAAWFNHFIVADILIKNHAKLDITDESGDTPLHDAAGKGSLDTAKRLIDAGAKINKKNKDKRTPLYLAQDNEHNKVADALIAASGDFGDMVAPKPKRKGISEKVYDMTWGYIVAIYDGAELAGSGVVVKPGIVATNRHVIEDSEDIGDIVVRTAENRLSIGKEHSYPVERIDGSDSGAETRDLCLLKVKGLKLKCSPIKIRKYHTLNIGEDVYAIGHPEGLELSLSTGIISQLRDDDENGRHIQTDAATSRGSSGGGLFDRKGNLVGLITWMRPGDEKDAQNLNFAIPADWLLGYFAK